MPATPFQSRRWQSHEDTRRLQGIVRERLAHDWPTVRMHPGDIDWWVVGTVGREPGLDERVRLWFRDDPGEPVAFGWFSPPSDLDFIVSPRASADGPTLIAEGVAWAEERHHVFAERGSGPLRAWIGGADPVAAAALATLGLVAEGGPGFVQLTGDLDGIDSWPPPAVRAGLTIRPIDPVVGVAARVVCGRAAFPSSTMTEERYRSTFESWLYRPTLDLNVVTDNGQVVAFALGWLDPATRIVALEPVGVHPDWQRRGLGAEICRATLRTARELGARRAMIAAEGGNAAALALYRHLGLAVSAEVVSYLRPIEAGQSGASQP